MKYRPIREAILLINGQERWLLTVNGSKNKPLDGLLKIKITKNRAGPGLPELSPNADKARRSVPQNK